MGGGLSMSPKEIIELVEKVYEPFKEAIDKYPKAFNVAYVDGQGYILTVDLDFLEQRQEGQD